MEKCGLSYSKASQVYDCMVTMFGDAVVSKSKVCIGRVGAFVPKMINPKIIRMGFRRKKGGQIEKDSREYWLAQRITYRFKIHKKFLSNHTLDWL